MSERIYYAQVQLWKMISFPRLPEYPDPKPIQTLRASDGYRLSRIIGDCALRIEHLEHGWTDEIDFENVAHSRCQLAPPSLDVPIPTIDQKTSYTQTAYQQSAHMARKQQEIGNAFKKGK